MPLGTNNGPAYYQGVKNSAGTLATHRFSLKFGSDFTVTDTSPDTVIALVANSLTVTAGTGLAGGGLVALGGSVTLSLPNVGTAGVNTLSTGDSFTTDAQGRVSAFSAVVRTISAGTGLTGGGTLAADRTISMPNVGPGAGSIGGSGSAVQSITLDAQGRVTAAAAVTLRYQTVQANAVAQTQRTNLNFSTSFALTDSAGSDRTSVDVAAGGISNTQLANSSLTVTAGTGLAGGGTVSLGGSVSLSLPSIGPGAGAIGSSSTVITTLTLDAQGRTTAASSLAQTSLPYSNVKNSAGTVQTTRTNLKFGSDFAVSDVTPDTLIALTNNSLTVTAGTGLSGGGAVALGGTTTLSLPSVGPGAGSIGGGTSVITSLTLDAQGRVTAATSGAPVPLGNRAVETLLTGTTQTAVATYTPGSTKGLWIGLYYRVVTATTNVTISISYTDVTGSQTLTVIPTTSTATGSYPMGPIFICATAASVTVNVTAGTANQVYVTASIVEA